MYLRIDGIFVQIDKVHLFSNLLHRSFGAKGGNIGTASMVSSSRSIRSIFSRICCIGASEQREAILEQPEMGVVSKK
jgi:hypothetical protein